MNPRRQYNVTNVADRARLLASYEQGGDFVGLANALGIKRSTAYNIVNIGRVEPLARGGAHNVVLSQEMKISLTEFIGENPVITLAQLRDKLIQRFPNLRRISLTTIKNALDGQFYTLKKVIIEPANRNSENVKEQRREYSQWFMQHGVNTRLIFLDEVGSNLWTRRSYGRARRGENCYHIVGNQ